jgi:hypothetical protein
VAELVGYDLEPGPYDHARPITVTLYWRALAGASAMDATVFAQLLSPEGRLVAQHDSPPAMGGRPTGGWVEGEIVSDAHPMVFREPYTGTATISVGLYDPATMQRVITDHGRDAHALPTVLTIAPP